MSNEIIRYILEKVYYLTDANLSCKKTVDKAISEIKRKLIARLPEKLPAEKNKVEYENGFNDCLDEVIKAIDKLFGGGK